MSSLSKFFIIVILKKTSSRIWEGKNLGVLTMIFGTITCTLERSMLTTNLSLVCSPQCPSCWFFSPSFFSSSLYLVHSFCLTTRKGEARKRTLTCYLVSSYPTHFSWWQVFKLLLLMNVFASLLSPIGLLAQSQRSRVRIPYKSVVFFPGFLLSTAKVASITVMIFFSYKVWYS